MTTETRTLILDTAERLFGDHGIEAVSLRQIMAEAGVNVAAIHYHFGSKDLLLREILKRIIEPINDIRLTQLKELRQTHGKKPIPIRDLLQIFLAPVIRMGASKDEKTKNSLKFIGRAHGTTNKIIESELFEDLNVVIQEFLIEFGRSLPTLSEKERGMRLSFIAGAMVQTILLPLKPIFVERMFGEMPSYEELLNMLVSFCCAGMSAENGSKK